MHRSRDDLDDPATRSDDAWERAELAHNERDRGFEKVPATRRCERCQGDFVPFDRPMRKQRFCSPGCLHAEKRDQRIAGYPPREEVEALIAGIDGLSDRQLGARYGHTGLWAFDMRRHYGIPAARPMGRRDGVAHKPLARKSDRARWGMHLKPENACRNCGRIEGRIHLHHAIPRSMCKAIRYDLRNGLPLCGSCHASWHHRTLTIYRDVFTEEEWAFLSAVELTGQLVGPWLDERYPDRGRPLRRNDIDRQGVAALRDTEET